MGDELTYVLYSCILSQYNNVTTADDADITSCSKISNTTEERVPSTGETSKLHTISKITLGPSSTTYYIVRVRLQNLDANQNYNMGKTLAGSINVEFAPPTLEDKILAAHPPVSDAITSTYVTSGSGINFGGVSSPANGQGLYINNKANVSGDPTLGTIKYFRGGTYCYLSGAAIESSSNCTSAGGTWSNEHCSLSDSQSACTAAGGTYYELKNNVMFGGYGWKIIRINADGSIRLIYNGTSPTARGTASQLSTTAFNTTNSYDKYIGYMYDTSTSSTIKGIVDSWYSSNLSSYASSLTDIGFCGDRTGNYTTGYGAYTRLFTINPTPSYNCLDIANDLYTTSSNSTGNKKLTYPIGLITADEVAYAGGFWNTNNYTHYLQSGSTYWTMSPYNWSGNAKEFGIHLDGSLTSLNVKTGYGVRPVINLKSNIEVSSGSGTLTDPWIVQ